MAINQLPAAYYTPAKFTMEAVSPRPDAESDLSGGAYYRYYHASMAYRARVAVRGGAWPLHYDLTTAPAGATIGNNYGDADYGVISWASPTGASETFTVTVTDQEGATLAVTWTATLDASKFVFVDADVAGPGTGTFADPLSDIDDIQSGHANKIAVLRESASQYLPTGSPAVGNTTYPSTLMGFPGESPIIDGANGRTNVNDTSADDLSIINIIYDGTVTTLSGHSHAIVASMNGGQGKRFLLWGCTFRNQNEGEGVLNDNPACLWFDGQTTEREYVAVVDNVQESTSITPFLNTFDVKRLLVENNTIADIDLTVNAGGSNTVHVSLKDRTSYFTFRNNSIIAPSHAGVMVVVFQQGNDVNTTDQEVCWNTIVATSTFSSGLLDWNGQVGEYPVVPNMYQYRNSIKAVNTGYCSSYNYFPTGAAPANPAYAVTVEDELWSNNGPSRYIIILNGSANNDGTVDTDLKYTFGAVAPVILDSSTDVDANGLLTGASRTTYLGTVGAEVGVNTVWSAATNTAGTSVTVTLNEAYTTTTAAYTDFTIAGHTITTGTGLQLTSGTSFTLTVDDAIGSHEDLVVTYDGTGDFTADSDSFVIAAGDAGLVNNSTVDQVAPVLTTPVGIQTGNTTATGTVTTDEGNGTLYWEVTASATPSASGPVATITSKQDLPSEYGETTDPLGVSFSTTTDGSGSGATLTCTARTFDAGMQMYRVDQFTLNAGGTGYQVGDSLVMQLNFPPFGDYPSCTVATTSSNATFISDATSAGNTQTVSATGSQIVSVTGLSAATSYYIHFLHVDAASNESNVSTSAQFTTQSLAAPTLEQGVMNPDLPVINSTGSTLTLTFSEAVTTSAATGLTLSTGETLTYSSGSTTDTIVYTISPYAQAGGGGEILNFAGGANVIEATVGGTDVEAFSDVLVSSQSTATAPVVVGDPTVDETGTVLTVVFSSASLANQTTPAYSPFTLTGTLGGVYTFTNASIPANTGIFTVSPAVEYNDVLSLSFTQAGGTFTDGTTGIELATFTDTVVNNTSATDNEPPIFTSDPAVSKTTVQGHSIRQTINETGVVYGVRLPAGSEYPEPFQVKAGTDSLGAAAPEAKSVATTAGSPCVLVFSSGAKNTEYDYYIVAEDSVPNLQAAVVKVTATTANLLFNGSGGKGLRPDEGSKKKVKMMWDSKNKRR